MSMTVTVTNTKDEAIGTMVPQGLWYSIAKIYWLALALIGTGTLTLSMWLSATNPANGGALNGIIFTLSYFTVWSNIVTELDPRPAKGMQVEVVGVVEEYRGELEIIPRSVLDWRLLSE